MPLDNAGTNPQDVIDAGRQPTDLDQSVNKARNASQPTPKSVSSFSPAAKEYYQEAQRGIAEIGRAHV